MSDDPRSRPAAEPSTPTPPGSSGPPGPPGPPGLYAGSGAEDPDTTVNVRRRQGVGPFPAQPQRPFPPDQLRPSATTPPTFLAETASKPRKPLNGLLLRIGDIPLRAVYTVAALIATIAAVVLVFTVFAEEGPKDTANAARAQPTGTGGTAAPNTATPAPTAVRLPPVPRAQTLTTLSGKAATVIGLVVDDKSGFTYARLGAPWTKATFAPFTAAQRVGKGSSPRTMIASGPLPGAAPAGLNTLTEYRDLAAKTARWTLRFQPTPTKVTWTASQPLAGGKGWVLGYRVSYQVQGKTRTSQAVVVVADTGKKKPGVLFATVAGSHKSQYRDLNTLVTSIQRAP
ncbi:hypothetical protein AB0K60_04245 [Thermopolyspora sp. NPDC052614]|uniref:hypothetical protein n=1 Tax=Thermopolyspora sp. NPDC052614 TaxID=3155682 RepID=UPI00343BD77F